MNDNRKLKDSWNDVYLSGEKYKGAPPVPFTNSIIETLKRERRLNDKGLYIGCGNGRNFLPLVNHGLDLTGLDISNVALEEISKRRPDIENKLVCSSFENFHPTEPFDYIISIQVFQHGNYNDFRNVLQKVVNNLKPGGLFFMRVRSVDNAIEEKYETIEKTKGGGFSIKYLSGSKRGLVIHFVSFEELEELPKMKLSILIPPYQVNTTRKPPKKGWTVHWEGIWQKN